MHTYYQLYKNSKDPIPYRIEIIKDAQLIGIKPSARKYMTSPKTVRKWLRRFEEEKKSGLKDRSKRPRKSPNEIKRFWYFKILDICKAARNNNKRINAAMIKRKHNIPYSKNTILKVMRDIDFLPQKRKKHQRKRDLREIKAKMKPFEKVQVDIKYLDDIPEMYGSYIAHKLPRYQITARDVSTGTLFYSYAIEKNSTNTTMFILELKEHLERNGIDLKDVTIQTDNGTEFTSPWNCLEDSPFTKAIKLIMGAKHVCIPPGAKTWQSDVETSHRLIEDELYACETFTSKNNFFEKAAVYQKFFNVGRNNSYKGATPKQLLNERAVNINPDVLIFKPVLIDTYYRKYKDIFKILSAENIAS
jgi:transposase